MYIYEKKFSIFKDDLNEFELRRQLRISSATAKCRRLIRRSRSAMTAVQARKQRLRPLPELKKSQRAVVLRSLQADLIKDIHSLAEKWKELLASRSVQLPTIKLDCNLTLPLGSLNLEKRIRVLVELGIIDVVYTQWKTRQVEDEGEQTELQVTHGILNTLCHLGVSTRSLQDILSVSQSPVKAYKVWQLKKQLQKELDQVVPIHPLKEGCDAYYIDPEKLLRYILPGMLQRGELKTDTITVCISGDGRNMNILREKSSIIISLKLSFGDNNSTKYLLPIALARGKESRENIELIMSRLRPSLSRIKTHGIRVFQQKVISVRLAFCSDGKFLLLTLGIHAANGKFSCPFCVLKKDFWLKFLEPCDEENSKNLRRSSDLRKRRGAGPCPAHTSMQTCGASAHGAEKENLIAGLIEQENIFIDELHLFLRLWDLAMDYLLSYCENYSIER